MRIEEDVQEVWAEIRRYENIVEENGEVSGLGKQTEYARRAESRPALDTDHGLKVRLLNLDMYLSQAIVNYKCSKWGDGELDLIKE